MVREQVQVMMSTVEDGIKLEREREREKDAVSSKIQKVSELQFKLY